MGVRGANGSRYGMSAGGASARQPDDLVRLSNLVIEVGVRYADHVVLPGRVSWSECHEVEPVPVPVREPDVDGRESGVSRPGGSGGGEDRQA